MKKFLIIGFGLLVLLSLFGCMTPEKHFKKFLDKGGVVNCKQDSVLVTDTLFLDGDTILIDKWKYIIKDSIHAVTKWETKYRYKIIKEQEKTKREESDNKRKEVIKKTKQDGKTARNQSDNDRKSKSKSWWKFLLGYILGLLSCFIVYNIWIYLEKMLL